MADNVLIRKLQLKDAEPICNIYASITKTPVSDELKHIIEEYAHKQSDSCFVAEFSGRVVGFMISYLIQGGFGVQQSVWIPMVGVSPEWMGKGIGKTLAYEIFNYFKDKGIKTIYTSARWFDADLLSFFKTLGFDRSDFINLQKELN